MTLAYIAATALIVYWCWQLYRGLATGEIRSFPPLNAPSNRASAPFGF